MARCEWNYGGGGGGDWSFPARGRSVKSKEQIGLKKKKQVTQKARKSEGYSSNSSPKRNHSNYLYTCTYQLMEAGGDMEESFGAEM
jgi:hypothetical protein